MAEIKNQFQIDDAIFLKTIASGCSSEIHKLLRLCDLKTTHLSNHALNWAVFEACNLRHAHLLQFLLKDGTRLELRDNNGNTPLMICSAKGFSDIVVKLLRLGADVNAKNNNGDTALMLATSRKVIQSLLQDSRLNLDERNSTGNTALMSAIETSHFLKVYLLINAGACPYRRVEELSQSGLFSLNVSGASAFDVAEKMGLDYLLELLYRANLVKSNPLQLAAVENDFESCITLRQNCLCDKNETQNIRPDILCCVLKQIQKRDAVLSTDIDLVRELCRLGIDVNRCQCCRKSRMDIVLNIGSYELAEILCDHGAKVTHDDLVSAIDERLVQMIPLLINHGAPINKYDHLGRVSYDCSALDVALENSLTGTASLLFNHGAAFDSEYAISQALKSNDAKTLSFLLNEFAEVTMDVVQNPETFVRAVTLGNVQVIQILLDAGLDINRVHDNKTPLMSAVHIEVINFLLNNGADVNLKTNTTPLINAVSWGYFSDSAFHKKLFPMEMEKQIVLVVDTFLKKGASLEDTDEHGCTALFASVNKGLDLLVLKYLLDMGADVKNRRNKDGLTALHLAAADSKYFCAKTLLEYGADVNLKCNAGCSPLHYAVGNTPLVTLFLEYQANVNATDDNGNTPLLIAVKRFGGPEDIIKLLIASGSDVNHKNHSGMSALLLAAEKLNTSIMAFLLDVKAEFNQDDLPQKLTLSRVLDTWFPSEQVKQTAMILIDHGTSADLVKQVIIHRLIAIGNDGILIQKLMKSGVCPTDIVLKRTYPGWPETSVSPLAVSLILDRVDFACYFIENWYLTRSDVKLLSRNIAILSYLEQCKCNALPYLEKVSRQPMRLELLCFIAVSSALGSDRDRRQRVHNSKLPAVVQNQLLYSKLEHKVLEPVSELYDPFYMLKCLYK
ncbi:serine/threonine-protein phosphatase 6 regulatory ankyrin repeat subunit B [Biomphalaria glabrata]|nr:serine/threonine-protein phosphatase 6 regulatory ankyrin repeat subunit B [Biomphalaria glabrata]